MKSRRTTSALALIALLATLAGAQTEGDPVLVTITDLSATPGDSVLVAVELIGLDGREIVSGEIGVRYDPSILTGRDVVREGSAIGEQRWLVADDIVTTSGDHHDFRVVYAAARGFSEDGDLVFLAFDVAESAVIGSTTTLEVIAASFNNGTPVTTLGTGTLRIVEEVVRADFVAFPRRGEVPLRVHFRDRSVGTIDTYDWDFGDGESSNERNPRHEYLDAGTYTVSLTVTGPFDTHTKVRTDYIAARPDETSPVIVVGPLAVAIHRTWATIIWLTNERSDSFVEYSTHPDFASSDSARVPDLVFLHRVRLTALDPGTRYYYRVSSADAAGNESRFKKGIFYTRRQPDARPPVITQGPAAEEIAEATARIVWETDEYATSVVEYATSANLHGAIRVEDEELIDEHSVLLEGLDADTKYHYRVQSTDASGNESRWKSGHFRTTPGPDVDPPVVLLGPTVIGRTHRAATIKLVANERVSIVVDYGPGTDYGFSESRDTRRRVNLVRLTNLEPNTLYHYQVTIADAAGLTHTTADHEFVTRSSADVQWPHFVIRPHVEGRFHDRVVVSWETDEGCVGMVEYGTDGEFGSIAYSGDEDRKHTAILTEVDADSEIHLRVRVTDASGNGPVLSDPIRSRTLADPIATPLLIVNGPIVASRESDRVTIAWRTNRSADSYVGFGTDETRGSRQGTATLATDHVVVLNGLEAGTLYHFAVVSTDPTGSVVSSDDRTFRTRPVPDELAPFLTMGPEIVGVTENSAFIRWWTNEPTDALVEYGLGFGYGQTLLAEDFTEDHKLSIVALEPGTVYHARVSSSDPSGNGPAISRDVSFQTLELADVQSPAIISGPGIVDLKSSAATIRWRTDEPTDGFVAYGESSDDLGQTVGSAVPTRRHEVTLDNLSPNTRYYYVARSTDLAGNTSTTDPAGNAPWSRNLRFRTREAEDTTAPIITRGPSLVVGNRGALIKFRTDERCVAELAYGTALTLGTPSEEVVFEREPTRQHRLRIGHLTPRTRYLFRLTCRDAAGNALVVGTPRRGTGKIVLADGAQGFGDAFEFTTEEIDDTAPPVIISGPTLVSRSSDTAIIEWVTDEPADSHVDVEHEGVSTTISDAEYTQEHRIIISGLESSTTYTYEVRSMDFAGNAPVTSQALVFTTPSDPDITPPVLLSGPEVIYVDDSRAIVEWQTDEATSPLVEYGQGVSLDRLYFDDVFATLHTIQLTGLEPSTEYRWQVSVTDPGGNVASDLLISAEAKMRPWSYRAGRMKGCR